MEAKTLQRKKPSLSKGKIKKTIKNIICRPDSFWPALSEDQGQILRLALNNYKITIPYFVKPHWNEIKALPKDKRPKPPKTGKIEGLFFGIITCQTAIQNKQCSGIVLESSVNPRMILQPIIDICVSNHVPVVCLDGLRKISAEYFGIATSCLGLQKECLPKLCERILQLAANFKLQEAIPKKEIMDCKEANTEVIEECKESVLNNFTYLYRTSKSTRVFVPSQKEVKDTHKFIGQNFIKVDTESNKLSSKAYMKMILKRVSNNQNRKRKTE